MKKLLNFRNALALSVIAISTPALAVDPTYTSQIKDALQAVNLTAIISDVGDFAALIFALMLTTWGVFYAINLIKKARS